MINISTARTKSTAPRINYGHPLANGLFSGWLFSEFRSPQIRNLNPHYTGLSSASNPPIIWRRSGSPSGGSYLANTGTNVTQVGPGHGLNNLQVGSIALLCRWRGTQTTAHVITAPMIGRSSSGVIEHRLYLSGTDPDTAFVRWQPFNATAATGTRPPGSYHWRHIVVTWETGLQNIYLDGSLDGTATSTGTITDSPGTVLGITYNTGTTADQAIGDVDHVYLYNRVLTQPEAAWLAKDWYAPIYNSRNMPTVFIPSAVTNVGSVFASPVFGSGIFGRG